MATPALDRADLLALLPEQRVGTVDRAEPITLGLSGAGVYSVTTSRGAYVLRVQSSEVDERSFAQHVSILRRAADARIAPAVVHVDEAARAVVSERVLGTSIAVALADPAQRAPVFASVVDRLRTLHAFDRSDISERDPISYARRALEAGRPRPGFPPWAVSLEPTFNSIAATLAEDSHRVVSHNDVNPVNVLWDGVRTWLVDWEVAGLGHRYYDIAVLALFLRFGDDVALDLCARHDGAQLDGRSRTSFLALRKLAGLLGGLTFLTLVDDLGVRPAPTFADAPTLGDFYAAMRRGELDLQSPRGRASMGLALLRESIARDEPG
jgi:aminoglycoside phosphotransferase